MDDTLVTIAVAPNEIVAMLWRSALEQSGIPVVVKTLGLGHAYWSPFAADHALLVRAHDVERARAILEAFTDDEDGPRSEEP